MNKQMPVAVVTGVGPGTGAAIARRFAGVRNVYFLGRRIGYPDLSVAR